ncbi:MAG: galactokinase [Gemmatimonadota bacterium]
MTDAAGVAAWFAECYGAPPAGVWFAPGRANLIGEHTDYNDGWVLPFALDRGVLVAAASRDDGLLAARSRQAPDGPPPVPAAGLAPGAVTGWAAYPAGVAWALRLAGQPAGAASLAVDSDLPQGAGLSSSAALECATALALTALAGTELARPRLAALARRAENEFVGVPSGIMDQSASLLCEAGHALLLDCRTGGTSLVPFEPAAAGLRVLLIDTRARHELTGGEYASRRAECEAAAHALGVASLRDVAGAGALSGIADPVLRRRARHVLTDNERVHEAVALLRAGGVGEIGPLLTASHASLRDDFEVSWPEADEAVAAAVAAGALGARMVGGGFGGSVIALVPADLDQTVRAAVRAAFKARGWPGPGFLAAAPSASARRLR